MKSNAPKISIDAEGKKIGRIATMAAAHLLGKYTVTFEKNKVAPVAVEIIHAKSADVSARKKERDNYVTYTGHRGGLNNESLGELINRRGMTEVLRRAIYRMLPDNKLRALRMKNLTITE